MLVDNRSQEQTSNFTEKTDPILKNISFARTECMQHT